MLGLLFFTYSKRKLGILCYVDELVYSCRFQICPILKCFISIFPVFVLYFRQSFLTSHVSSPQPSYFPVGIYKDQMQRECCLDGMKETTLLYTCERRSEYIFDGAACVEAFLHCCKEMESMRVEKKEDSLKLARSKRWVTREGAKGWVGYPLSGIYQTIRVVTFLMTL